MPMNLIIWWMKSRRTYNNKIRPTKIHPTMDGDNLLSKLSQTETRTQICVYLSRKCNQYGRLENGACTKASRIFGRSMSGIRSIWAKHLGPVLAADRLKFDCTRKIGSGRPLKYYIEDIYRRIKTVPFQERTTIRSLAMKINISRTQYSKACFD